LCSRAPRTPIGIIAIGVVLLERAPSDVITGRAGGALVRSRLVFPLVHLPLFLSANLAWVIAVTGAAMTVAVLVSGRSAEFLLDPDALLEWFGAGGVGLLTVLQITGFAAIASVMCLFLPAPAERRPDWLPPSLPAAWDRLRAGLALEWPSLVWLTTSLVAATTVWMFPTWLAERLLEIVPEYVSGLEVIGKLLQESAGIGRLVMVGAIVITAPIFEELMFRGYLWRVVEIAAPRWVAAVVTTLLFAAYHLDPVHVIALLPTAAFLGWLRYASGSIVPCILAHLTNNLIATALAFGQDPEATNTITFGLAITGLAFTVVTSFVGWRFSKLGGARGGFDDQG
jgi:membrane protease YdiL (CAAX protease family)